MTMVIMPFFINNEPDRCPKCDRIENIKEVCAHCGYEYKEEPMTWFERILGFAMLIVGLIVAVIGFAVALKWIIFPVFEWIFGY